MFTHPLTTKLNFSNFLQWRQLAMAVIKGNRILSYITDKNLSLEEFLVEKSKQEHQISDAFLQWNQID